MHEQSVHGAQWAAQASTHADALVPFPPVRLFFALLCCFLLGFVGTHRLCTPSAAQGALGGRCVSVERSGGGVAGEPMPLRPASRRLRELSSRAMQRAPCVPSVGGHLEGQRSRLWCVSTPFSFKKFKMSFSLLHVACGTSSLHVRAEHTGAHAPACEGARGGGGGKSR